jgi:hypothetical protein
MKNVAIGDSDFAYNGCVGRILVVFFLFLIATSAKAVSFYSESNTILFVGELKGELIWGMFDPDADESYFNGESDGGEVEILLDDVKVQVSQEKGDPDSEFWTETVGFLILGRDVLQKYDLKFNMQTSDLKFLPRNGEISTQIADSGKKYISQSKTAMPGSPGYYAFPSIAFCGVRKSVSEMPLTKRSWTNGNLKVVSSMSGYTPTVLVEDSRTSENVFGITEIGCQEVLVRIGENSELSVWGAGEVKSTAAFLSHALGTPVYELHDTLFLNNAVLLIDKFEEEEDVAVIKIGGSEIVDAWSQYVNSGNEKRISMLASLLSATDLTVRYDEDEYSAKFDPEVLDNELYTEKEIYSKELTVGKRQSRFRSIRRSGMNHIRPIKTYSVNPARGMKKQAPIPMM